MTTKRLGKIIYLILTVAFATIHYIWGQPILQFLAKYPLYWSIAGIATLLIIDAIITLVSDMDVTPIKPIGGRVKPSELFREENGIVPGDTDYSTDDKQEDTAPDDASNNPTDE